MSLTDPERKMSKSDNNPRSRILLCDSDEEIRSKIKGAVTDSELGISYDREKRPGVSNLLSILLELRGLPIGLSDFAKTFSGSSMRDFKDLVATEIINHISPIRDRYLKYITQEGLLKDIREDGAAQARSSAALVLSKVHEAIGAD